MNLPNMLSLSRLVLSPVIIWMFVLDKDGWGYIIFGLAGLTDILDGFIARKYDIKSKLGKAIDPLADKVLALSVLFSISVKGIIPSWIPEILLLKEMIMIIGGLFLWNKGIVIPANIYGKTATMLIYASVLSSYIDKRLGFYGLVLALAVSVAALLSYVRLFFKQRAC